MNPRRSGQPWQEARGSPFLQRRGVAGLSASTARLRQLLGLPQRGAGEESKAYGELREAYLQRARELHPDRGGEHSAFVELQSAWTTYASAVPERDDSDLASGDGFTHFGVGCSFSDSRDEREAREALMDAAGRGWIPRAVIAERTVAAEKKRPRRGFGRKGNANGNGESQQSSRSPPREKKSLVQPIHQGALHPKRGVVELGPDGVD